MRRKIASNNKTTWSKAQLIAYAKTQELRAEAYNATIDRKNREFAAMLAEARRRTIPYSPNGGRCYNDRIEPGLTVNILPIRVTAITLSKRYSSSPINAKFLVEVEGRVVINVEGKDMSPYEAERLVEARRKETTASGVMPAPDPALERQLEAQRETLVTEATK